MEVIEYNKNYVIKLVGYFRLYTYKYKDYEINKNILEPDIIKDRIGIVYLSNRSKTIYINITNMLILGNFLNYKNFVFWMDKRINTSIKDLKLNIKDYKSLLITIKIWIFRDITKERLIKAAQKLFDKKLLKFQRVLDKLVNYKIDVSAGKQKFSRFLTEKILTKELKPVLYIKIKNTEAQDDCLKHLLNLMSKKWPGVKAIKFKEYMHKAIKSHQDNYEHDDVWFIYDKEKEKIK